MGPNEHSGVFPNRFVILSAAKNPAGYPQADARLDSSLTLRMTSGENFMAWYHPTAPPMVLSLEMTGKNLV
jgi:hypothetical protein